MKKILCTLVLTVTFLGAFPALADAQQWGLTANALYWATATPNIGVEYAFHSKMSIAGLVQYNPFTYAKNRKMKHLAGQLEYRYWLSDVFKDFTADGISVDITVRVSPSLHTASASIEDWQNVEWGQGIITY